MTGRTDGRICRLCLRADVAPGLDKDDLLRILPTSREHRRQDRILRQNPDPLLTLRDQIARLAVAATDHIDVVTDDIRREQPRGSQYGIERDHIGDPDLPCFQVDPKLCPVRQKLELIRAQPRLHLLDDARPQRAPS